MIGPGAGGMVLLPSLDGERTLDLPDGTSTLRGLARASMTPADLARAAARQAAWVLSGSDGPPQWAPPGTVTAPGEPSDGVRVRAAYASARDLEVGR